MVKLILKEAIEARGITRYRLSEMTEIRYHVIDNYYKNKVTRYDSYVLDRVCAALECNVSDIIEYVNENETP